MTNPMCLSMMLFMMLFIIGINAMKAKIHASEVINTTLSGKYDTLLSFESPPIAVSCQPTDLLNFTPLDQELKTSPYLSTGRPYGNFENKEENQAKYHPDSFATYLKASPKKPSGIGACSFQLADHTAIQIRFQLSDSTIKPFISFGNSRGNEQTDSQGFGDLDLFKKVINDQWDSLIDVTFNHYRKRVSTKKETKTASYQLIKTGIDTKTGQGRAGYKIWLFQGVAKATITPSTKLNGFLVGELYLSVFKPIEKERGPLIAKGERFHLYLLSNKNLKISQLLRNLP